jgi:hypothetical protein
MTYCYKLLTLLHLTEETREMKNISRGPPFGDFVTVRTGRLGRSMLDDTGARLEYRLLSPPSSKCNVLRESPSVDSQNIPCATLKRRGSWVISVYLCRMLCTQKDNSWGRVM